MIRLRHFWQLNRENHTEDQGIVETDRTFARLKLLDVPGIQGESVCPDALSEVCVGKSGCYPCTGNTCREVRFPWKRFKTCALHLLTHLPRHMNLGAQRLDLLTRSTVLNRSRAALLRHLNAAFPPSLFSCADAR